MDRPCPGAPSNQTTRQAHFRQPAGPLLFLWLLVPFGGSLTPYLMALTTEVTAAGLSLFGLDVTTDGNILITEAGRVGIIAECSALDFLIGNLVLSLFFASLVYDQPRKRVAYVAAGLVLAIVANNVRTISVVLVSHWSNGAWDLLSDHGVYGWLVFLLFVVLQMLIGARFKDPNRDLAPPLSTRVVEAEPARQRTLLVATGLVALFVLTPMASSPAPLPALPPVPELSAPRGMDRVAPDDRWRPLFVGAQAELLATHAVANQPVNLYVGYYWQEAAGGELIGWPNAVYDRKAWHLLEHSSRQIALDGETLALTESRLRGPQRARRLAWHWYWVDGRFTAKPLVAKLLQAKAKLLGGDSRSAAIVVSTPEGPDPAASRRAMQRFVQRAVFLEPMLQQAGSQTD